MIKAKPATNQLHDLLAKGGGNCPCCGQWVQVYKRHLNASMALQLWRLAQHTLKNNKNPKEYTHYTVFNGGADFAKLRFWGFVEHKENTDQSKRDSGLWRITEKGWSFILNNDRVPAGLGWR